MKYSVFHIFQHFTQVSEQTTSLDQTTAGGWRSNCKVYRMHQG